MNNIEVISGLKDELSHCQDKESKGIVRPSLCRSDLSNTISLIRG